MSDGKLVFAVDLPPEDFCTLTLFAGTAAQKDFSAQFAAARCLTASQVALGVRDVSTLQLLGRRSRCQGRAAAWCGLPAAGLSSPPPIDRLARSDLLPHHEQQPRVLVRVNPSYLSCRDR